MRREIGDKLASEVDKCSRMALTTSSVTESAQRNGRDAK